MIQFGCDWCKINQHEVCKSLWRYEMTEDGKLYGVKRPQPSPTHCDCQHRERK